VRGGALKTQLYRCRSFQCADDVQSGSTGVVAFTEHGIEASAVCAHIEANRVYADKEPGSQRQSAAKTTDIRP